MKTVLVRKKGTRGGILGYKRITLLESFIKLSGVNEHKGYYTYFLAETDGKLNIVAANDLWVSIDDYVRASKGLIKDSHE